MPELESPWPRTSVDAFVLRRLREPGITPSPEADRRTLIRRVAFDLLGLPPSPQEIQAFERDGRSDAYERLVDRLLASPRYGERWGRHWLDVVHYGETHGYDKDKLRPDAWPYRDWVIQPFNDDKPYTRFDHEQLAGDGRSAWRCTHYSRRARRSECSPNRIMRSRHSDLTEST